MHTHARPHARTHARSQTRAQWSRMQNVSTKISRMDAEKTHRQLILLNVTLQ